MILTILFAWTYLIGMILSLGVIGFKRASQPGQEDRFILQDVLLAVVWPISIPLLLLFGH